MLSFLWECHCQVRRKEVACQDFLYLFGILGGMLACLKLPLAGLLYVCKSLAHSKATYAMFRKPRVCSAWGTQFGWLLVVHVTGAFQIDAVWRCCRPTPCMWNKFITYSRYKYGSWPCPNLKRLKTKYTSLSNKIENKNHFCLKATSNRSLCTDSLLLCYGFLFCFLNQEQILFVVLQPLGSWHNKNVRT